MYHPASAGHAAREAPRDIRQDNIDELVEKATVWLAERTLSYPRVIELTEGMNVSQSTAGHLAIHPHLQKNDRFRAGIAHFISALWNHRCPESTITYPHNTPSLDGLGYLLPQHKTLIMSGCATNVGMSAKGPLIITGTADSGGWYARGPVIMINPTKYTGYYADGWLITPTARLASKDFFGTHITPLHYWMNRPLKVYVDKLLRLAKYDPPTFEKELGDGATITKDIRHLIEQHNWGVWKPKPHPWGTT